METRMNQETFNLSIRKFLKMVGINSQREIEQAVTKGLEAGTHKGTGSLPARGTPDGAGVKNNRTFVGASHPAVERTGRPRVENPRILAECESALAAVRLTSPGPEQRAAQARPGRRVPLQIP